MLQGILREDAIKKKNKKALLHHTRNQILPPMGCSQHEVHTTLICTCRYAALRVFLRYVQMCTPSPHLEYKLPPGRTWVFQFSPPQGLARWSGQAKPSAPAVV